MDLQERMCGNAMYLGNAIVEIVDGRDFPVLGARSELEYPTDSKKLEEALKDVAEM